VAAAHDGDHGGDHVRQRGQHDRGATPAAAWRSPGNRSRSHLGTSWPPAVWDAIEARIAPVPGTAFGVVATIALV
jgi:hypothetical protein